MESKHGIVTEMPIGYRFVPTDEELIKDYLMEKVLNRPLPAQVIQDIDPSELYSKPPKSLVTNSCNEKEWYFFIHNNDNFHEKSKTIRIVGNGIGFWRSMGDECPIYNSDGDVFAFKKYWNYFAGSLPKAKKTHWRMEEYQTSPKCSNKELEIEEWVLGRIKSGRDYKSYF